MASEVNHHVGYSRENECWFVRFYPYQTEQQASEAAAAFTRPAPAATDTGLVTWKFHAPVNGSAKMIQSDNGEWVTRSQAEELLAAERAEHDNTITTLTSLIADNAAKDARIKELEDYAREATKAITSLTAGGSEYFGKRIGEVFTADIPFCLERIRSRYASKTEVKRLETQLAAARKISQEVLLLIAGDESIPGHIRAKSRAALEGRP